MQTIPASPGPSHTELEPSVHDFDKNLENDEMVEQDSEQEFEQEPEQEYEQESEQECEVEEQDETLDKNETVNDTLEQHSEAETVEIQPIGKTLEIEQISTATETLAIDSLEARIEETIEQETKSDASEQESTELPGTPRSLKAAELSDEALTKAISDLSAVGGKITPELVRKLTDQGRIDLLAVGI